MLVTTKYNSVTAPQ